MEQLRDSAIMKDCASITDGILGTALNHRWYISSYNSQNGLFPLLAGGFFPFSDFYILHMAIANMATIF